MNQKKEKVIYWNNIPAPYMVERFNAVADRGNLNFEAWFNERTVQRRSWTVDESSWRFHYRYMPAITFAGRQLQFPIPLLGKQCPDVLVSGYAEPSYLFGWSIARLRRVRTAFVCEITWDRWIQRRLWKEKLKRAVLPSAFVTISPGEDGRSYAMRYGVPDSRALSLMHVIDVKHFTESWAKACPRRDQTRAKLGLKGPTFVYVGRLWWGKGIKYLLDAFRRVQSQANSDVSLLLVGDGPEEASLRQICKDQDIQNVIFAGFQQKLDLPPYYAVSDIFVFPTLGDPYGLVVDEAMACSLPIISTSAAGEILDRVEEGVNGCIVSPEDSEALADRMLYLVNNPELREQMGKASAKKIVGRTPGQWAKDFELIVERIIAMPL
jgi:glycosyltransferase involved in cell wall biosynthesis